MLHEGQLLKFLNIWTPLSACRSAFSCCLVFRPLCKIVHEAAPAMGSLTHGGSVFGHTICTQCAAFSVAAPLNSSAIGDALQAGLRVRFVVHTENLTHLRHTCVLAIAGQAGQLAGIF